jgi:hypothetical protein
MHSFIVQCLFFHHNVQHDNKCKGIAGLWISAWGIKIWLSTGQCRKVQDRARKYKTVQGECRTVKNTTGQFITVQDNAGQRMTTKDGAEQCRIVQDNAVQRMAVHHSEGQCRIVQDKDSAR